LEKKKSIFAANLLNMEQGWVKTNSYLNGEVAKITFFHPQSNSLPGELLKEIAKEIELSAKDPKFKVILLQSEGEKAFCAGASFDELIGIETEEDGLNFFSGFAKVINAIRKAPKFVIVRVQNKAVGGGVGIACSADYCFATSKASTKLSELAVGIGPFVVGPAVERKVGKSAFQQMTIHASKWHSADWAREKGMYNEVFETEVQMDEAIQSLLIFLLNANPEAMADLKKVFWEGTDDWDDLLINRAKISGKLVLSEFTKKAIERFRSK
jgi:methylglutaconyl-CoA hydratase